MTKPILCMLLLTGLMGFGQQIETYELDDQGEELAPIYQSRKNLVKFNFTGLLLKNYQFQGERVLNKTFSLGLSYGFMPKGGIPWLDNIESLVDDEDLMNTLGDATISYNAITPEVRIYMGKGYGKGFYIAPFYRHSSYKFEHVNIEFSTDLTTRELSMGGDLKGNTFGLLLGTQFNLGNSLVLDWWILGPHYGGSKGNFKGTSDQPLSQQEQDALLEELESLDIPLVDTEYTVDSTGATMVIDGPFAGIRAGFSLGLRF